MYRFKFYFKNGVTKLGSGYGKRPTLLYNDFDGLMDWEELDKLNEANITTKKILEIAFDVYKKVYKEEYYRIEIINTDTFEIVDYIEKK